MFKKISKMMLLSSSVLVLSGCEQVESLLGSSPDTEETQSTATKPTESQIDAHQQLLDSLPKASSSTDWELRLVNPEVELPEDFTVNLETVDNQQQIDERIIGAWAEMKQAAFEDGHELFFASGFRAVEEQEVNFSNTYQEHLADGLSEEEALEETKAYLTEPGHSEHHTGLALDIVDGPWIVAGRGLEQAYETQESYDWLIDNMSDYGFILRYPEGKEDITQISYEPWHFRYVGVENAKFMEEHALVLEEYIALLEERDR